MDNNLDVVTLPVFGKSTETQSNKVSLQVELLKLQVENAKREIYARELAIFEKEKLLSEQEKKEISKKCESIFSRSL